MTFRSLCGNLIVGGRAHDPQGATGGKKARPEARRHRIRRSLATTPIPSWNRDVARVPTLVTRTRVSEWDQFTRKQYGRWAAKNVSLDDRDSRLLQQHAQLRRGRGWGKGFEQAFYVDEDIETASRTAASSGVLTKGEAEAERSILLHFSRREPRRGERRWRWGESPSSRPEHRSSAVTLRAAVTSV